MSPTQTFQHRRQTLRQRGTCDRTAHSRHSLHEFSVMVIGSAVDTRTGCSEMFKTEDKGKKKIPSNHPMRSPGKSIGMAELTYVTQVSAHQLRQLT